MIHSHLSKVKEYTATKTKHPDKNQDVLDVGRYAMLVRTCAEAASSSEARRYFCITCASTTLWGAARAPG